MMRSNNHKSFAIVSGCLIAATLGVTGANQAGAATSHSTSGSSTSGGSHSTPSQSESGSHSTPSRGTPTGRYEGNGASFRTYADGNGGNITIKTREDGTTVKTDAGGHVMYDSRTTADASSPTSGAESSPGNPTSGPKQAETTETSGTGGAHSSLPTPTSGPKQTDSSAQTAKANEPHLVEVNGHTIKIKEFTNDAGDTVLVKSNETGGWVKTSADGKQILDSKNWTDPSKVGFTEAGSGSSETPLSAVKEDLAGPKTVVSDARYVKKAVELARAVEATKPGEFSSAMAADYNMRAPYDSNIPKNVADEVMRGGKLSSPVVQAVDKGLAKFSILANGISTLDAYDKGDTYGVVKSGLSTAAGVYGFLGEGAAAGGVGVALAAGFAGGDWARPYLNEAPLMKSADEYTVNAMQQYGVAKGTAIGAVAEAAALPGAAVQAASEGAKNWWSDYNGRLQNSHADARDDYLQPSGGQAATAQSTANPDSDHGRDR